MKIARCLTAVATLFVTASVQQRDFLSFPLHPSIVKGRAILVTATLSPVAVHSGIEVLRQGGTAADAAATVALSEIATNLGSVVSYAGISQLLYFDAKTEKVYALDAGWGTYAHETDPKSIPPPTSASSPVSRAHRCGGRRAGPPDSRPRIHGRHRSHARPVRSPALRQPLPARHRIRPERRDDLARPGDFASAAAAAALAYVRGPPFRQHAGRKPAKGRRCLAATRPRKNARGGGRQGRGLYVYRRVGAEFRRVGPGSGRTGHARGLGALQTRVARSAQRPVRRRDRVRTWRRFERDLSHAGGDQSAVQPPHRDLGILLA